jgi:acetoin utilization protein AcuB
MKHRRLQVRDLMTKDPITAGAGLSLYDAYALMYENEIRRLPVIQHGKLAGIVTLSDIQRAFSTIVAGGQTTAESTAELRASTLTAGDIMSSDPITVAPGDTIQDAAEQMLENQVSGLPVVEDGRVVGIVTESDIFRLVVASWSEERALVRS